MTWLVLASLCYFMGVHFMAIDAAESFKKDPDKAGVLIASFVIGLSWPAIPLFYLLVGIKRLGKLLL